MSASTTRQVIEHPSKAPITAIGSSVIVSGHLVFMAGAIGVDEAGNWVEGTVQDRAKAAFARVADRLSVLGLGLEDLLSVTIYLSKYEQDFADFNEAYSTLFGVDVAKPCRTCVGVAALPAGTDIEVTCVAAKRG
ncbi:Endoribonuclease L-PSP/chorismate mutase-like protein [Leucosporidium creatinivorum]|uniref:Endoribonuclease L-PSP/chorismate mutase-like protein n=1 Tax=Leucosporidium creatinivorum TaxID=106004 RepID=A0A1Y2FHZ9_9BASI|nr:Endoribonuclease L-PSP/chorismate mutase-like protein [Leucosporidium creatinivorum]